MKKTVSLLITLILFSISITSCAAETNETINNTSIEIKLQLENSTITVNGKKKEIDSGNGTAPVIQDNRTFIPVRTVIEAMGGAVEWEADTQTAILAKDDTIIILQIGNKTAFVNENKITLDTEPRVINGRTMLPIRFIAENFGFNVDWNNSTQTIIITN